MSAERAAMERFGFTRDQYRLYIAVHELGHAVAGIASGYDCSKVKMDLRDNGHRVRGEATPSLWGKKDRVPELTFLHGGFIASEMHLRRLGLWTSRREQLAQANARGDFELAASLKPSSGETNEAISQARRHLERHWTVIDYTAPQLVKKGRLSFRQLRSVPGW